MKWILSHFNSLDWLAVVLVFLTAAITLDGYIIGKKEGRNHK